MKQQSESIMKILYVHGFGSHYDPCNNKVQALSQLGEVVGVNIDYCDGFEKSFDKVIEAATNCDLIVGTSMGGYMASHVGAAAGIPFVALNPAVEPQKTLQKHEGSFVDYSGFAKNLSQKAIASYPMVATSDGCGLVLLQSADDVIDPKITEAMLSGVYNVKVYEGGSHRFEGLESLVGEISAFVDRAEMVYGS